MAPDLLDLIPDYEPDYGHNGPVYFQPTPETEHREAAYRALDVTLRKWAESDDTYRAAIAELRVTLTPAVRPAITADEVAALAVEAHRATPRRWLRKGRA
jgi:hypothetical protein